MFSFSSGGTAGVPIMLCEAAEDRGRPRDFFRRSGGCGLIVEVMEVRLGGAARLSSTLRRSKTLARFNPEDCNRQTEDVCRLQTPGPVFGLGEVDTFRGNDEHADLHRIRTVSSQFHLHESIYDGPLPRSPRANYLDRNAVL